MEKRPMSHVTPRSIARLTHLLELAVAAGVLAALAVPAFLFPAIRNGGSGWENNMADAEAPVGETYAAVAVSRGRLQPEFKDASNVTEHFAVQAIEGLYDRFEFSRRMVSAAPQVTDADVKELVELAMMGNVEAAGQPLTDHLVHWDWLVHLEAVNLSNTQVTDAAVVHLAKLTTLEDVMLSNTQVTDDGVRRLASLPNLKFLVLCNTKITDESLSHLAGCQRLESLDLDSTNVTDRGIEHLAGVRSLLSLYLPNTQITNKALASVAKLERLEELSLEDCPIDDEGIRHLAHLRGLQFLTLDNTGLTNEGLESLFDLQQLTDLSIVGTKVDARGCSLLRAALPDCDVGDQASPVG
jgi:hypothetical protein